MRQARILSDGDAWYHVVNRVVGPTGFFPFLIPAVQRRLLELIFFYTDVYCCRLAGYIVLGNHYHLIVFVEQYRELSREELEARARRLYGPHFRLRLRTERQWQRFNRRLFSLSELMRNIDGSMTMWLNPRYGRRGPLWADRFRSVWLEDGQAVQDGLLYVDLNAIRAGLVERPEEWTASSACRRLQGRDEGLVPLSEIFFEEEQERVFESYRMRLLYRGMEPGREGQARIPEWVVESERQRGFSRPGMFRQSLRLMTDGVVLGSRAGVEAVLGRCRQEGIYRRRCRAVSHLGGLFFTLREQRRRRTRSSGPLHSL